MLLWNVILAAMDYFTQSFPNYKPSFALIVAVTAPMLIVQAILFFFLQYIPMHFKMTVVFATMTIIVALDAIVPTACSHEATGYWIILTLALMLGVCMAILQSALYGTAGPCAELTNRMNLGVGISGLSINCLRMVDLAVLKYNPTSAYVFFFTAFAFLVLCTILAFRFVRAYDADQAEKKITK